MITQKGGGAVAGSGYIAIMRPKYVIKWSSKIVMFLLFASVYQSSNNTEVMKFQMCYQLAPPHRGVVVNFN